MDIPRFDRSHMPSLLQLQPARRFDSFFFFHRLLVVEIVDSKGQGPRGKEKRRKKEKGARRLSGNLFSRLSLGNHISRDIIAASAVLFK